tara:strand:- start:210 stop:1277 length:1068 start_codon:yes stop_codon:yes gene_type:complete
MANISMNKYKYILDRLLALIIDNPVEFNKRYSEYPVELIARWIQRSDDDINFLIGDQLADEAEILKFILPKMKENFSGDFVYTNTPEGAKFWKDVYEDRDLYYNIYPIIYNSDSIAKIQEKALLALQFIEINDGWDVKNSYSGDIDGYNKNALKNLMVNQALQGNQMDFSIFQNNVNANKQEGGFDWDNSPQGESFWTELEGSTERDRISMFRGNDINDFAEQDVIRESNPTTTTQINTKASDLVKEIEEGENRVEYFRDTKQDSLKEFAKDFPEAEAPLNKLLDLLSIKEEDRLNKSPKKKKKKEEVESEAELTAKDITELIEGLELAFEYLDGEDLQDATEQIEGLKITLDYI